jgi:hypothetical protein
MDSKTGWMEKIEFDDLIDEMINDRLKNNK